ncbi:MAG TPA: peptidyl-prolyl cis-trans isomerase [Candidatus Nanopelagicales bacterium]|nr:peptidyl-prolyl cis-trans isomerase [Candidatus Nanopelagicales bacterium]
MARAAVISTLLAASLAALLTGCNEGAVQPPPDGSAPAFGLSAEQSARVLAKVGDRVITLGDFGRTLERMDQFDRLRYQSKERRRELLSELIDVELLALEAKRRGFDRDPEVEDAIRQVLREAMVAQARQGLPSPAEIKPEEVRAYFEANADKFNEPERRRVSAIVLKSRAEAAKVLEEAEKASHGSAWGELFYKHSITAPKERGPNAPLDLAGDLGIVGAPGDARGANPGVPEPVRAAVFGVAKVGAVAGEVVEADGKFYVVRMSGLTPGHRRTLAEADRSIRVSLLQQKLQERDRALEEELKKKIRVELDEAALATVKVPESVMSPPFSTYQPPGSPPPQQQPDAGTPQSDGGR